MKGKHSRQSKALVTQLQIDDLPDPCLERLFVNTCFKDRLLILPLVSKRWNNVLKHSRLAWSTLRLSDLPVIAPLATNPQKKKSAIAWFQKRGNAIQHLALDNSDYATESLDLFITCGMPYMAANVESLKLTAITFPWSFIKTLYSLRQLRHLEMHFYDRTDYDDICENNTLHAISLLPHLTSIYFRNFEVDETDVIPEVVLGLTQLRELAVGAGQPQGFCNLTNLQHLEMYWLEKDVLPQVTHLCNLQSLIADWTSYSLTERTVPRNITCLSSLTYLHLSGFNGAEAGHVSGLTNLTYLRFDYARLDEIPTSISTLCQLQVLSLSHNTIEEIPPWFPDCFPNLKVLDLVRGADCGREVIQLPCSFTNLQSLLTLVLDDSSSKFYVNIDNAEFQLSLLQTIDSELARVTRGALRVGAKGTCRIVVTCLDDYIPHVNKVQELVVFLRARVRLGALEDKDNESVMVFPYDRLPVWTERF